MRSGKFSVSIFIHILNSEPKMKSFFVLPITKHRTGFLFHIFMIESYKEWKVRKKSATTYLFIHRFNHLFGCWLLIDWFEFAHEILLDFLKVISFVAIILWSNDFHTAMRLWYELWSMMTRDPVAILASWNASMESWAVNCSRSNPINIFFFFMRERTMLASWRQVDTIRSWC